MQAQLGGLLDLLALPNAPADPASLPPLLQAAAAASGATGSQTGARRRRARLAARRKAIRSGMKALFARAPAGPSIPGDPTAEAQQQALVGLMHSSLMMLRAGRHRGK
jgi:hypothetical protein